MSAFWLLLAWAFAPAPDSKYLVTDLKSDHTASYVVVAPDEFAEDCDRLLAHRQATGHTVALVRASDIAGAFGNGALTADALLSFTKHAADRWKTRFLLLAGDADRIPAHIRRSEYQTTRFANEEELGTDHLYSEPGLCVGRFPADTREELHAMIRKTIDYETNVRPGPWQRRISFITGQADFGSLIDSFIESQFTKIVTDTIPAEYDIELAYAKPTSPYCPYPARFNDNALRLLNEGALFYVYVGHGKRTGCDLIEFKGKFYPILEEAHVPDIRIREGPPIMIVLACSTGEFDAKTGDCLGEALLKSPSGPVAFIGGSRITQPYANTLLGRELIAGFLRDQPTAGEALFAGKRGVLDNASNLRKVADRLAGLIQGSDALEPMRKDVVMHYNLLGDPALILRRPPNGLTIETTLSGRKLAAKGRSPMKQGRALVSVSCPREAFLRPPVRIPASDPDLARRFLERYQAANDKTIARAEVEVRDGIFEIEFDVPAGTAAGPYFIRAFAWNGDASAAGVAEVALEGVK
ncbi:MAG: hypothetical protein HYY16_09975 [Planctomycetes bacterium]|nr:hypothetical protein [Planctomycetota bacterium]